MTDEQIIKALECCEISQSCVDCPKFASTQGEGCAGIISETLDLINRQRGELRKKQVKIHKLLKELNQVQDYYEISKAEIERLKLLLAQEEKSTISLTKKIYKEAKAEAIKEFGEGLPKKTAFRFGSEVEPVIFVLWEDILKTLKEMVGDAE